VQNSSLRQFDLLYFLLRPLQIPLNISCGFHALGEVRSRLRQSCSRLRLQGKQFSVLCIELARPAVYQHWLVANGLVSLSHFPENMTVGRLTSAPV